MAVSVNVTTVQPGGKEVKKSINYVNPSASNGSVSSFIGALNSLSDNTLTKIEKVSKSDLDIPTESEGD